MSVNKEMFNELVASKVCLMATADPDFALILYSNMDDGRKFINRAKHVAVGTGFSVGLLVGSIIAGEPKLVLGSAAVGSATVPVFYDVYKLYKRYKETRMRLADLIVYGHVPQETIDRGDPTGELGREFFDDGPVGENYGWFIGGGKDQVESVDRLLEKLYFDKEFRKIVTEVAVAQFKNNPQRYAKYLKSKDDDDNNNDTSGDDDNNKYAF